MFVTVCNFVCINMVCIVYIGIQQYVLLFHVGICLQMISMYGLYGTHCKYCYSSFLLFILLALYVLVRILCACLYWCVISSIACINIGVFSVWTAIGHCVFIASALYLGVYWLVLLLWQTLVCTACFAWGRKSDSLGQSYIVVQHQGRHGGTQSCSPCKPRCSSFKSAG